MTRKIPTHQDVQIWDRRAQIAQSRIKYYQAEILNWLRISLIGASIGVLLGTIQYLTHW